MFYTLQMSRLSLKLIISQSVHGLHWNCKICAIIHLDGKDFKKPNDGSLTNFCFKKFTIRMTGIRISAQLRRAYITKLFQLPVSVIDATSPGKISSRLTTNANTIQMGISQQLAMLVQSLAFTIGLYVVSFIRGPLLTLVASATLPLSLIVYGITIPIVFKSGRRSEKFKEEASGLAFEIFETVRIVHAFGAQAKLGAQHEKLLAQARKIDQKISPLHGLMMAPMFFTVYATFALTFWFGLQQYQKGHIDGVGSIVVVLFSVNFAVSQLGRIATPILAMTRAATAAMEIFATLETPTPDMSGLKGPDVSAKEDVVFRGVTFAYPTRKDKIILDNLNLTFEVGKTTAIVGPSGSGKSTIVGLIQRWYEPTDPVEAKAAAEAKRIEEQKAEAKRAEEQKKATLGDSKETEIVSAPESVDTRSEIGLDSKTSEIGLPESPTISRGAGNILIGGVDLGTIDAKWWRSNVGLVSQEPYLFNDTIFSNVANGLCGTQWEKVSKEEKMEMVKHACKEAFADEYISRLPEGYETKIGERGIKISGGQRQRLAIARAIIKQPPILILDEATSAIDVRTERIVQRALDRVSEGRTTITIAHRLSTIKRADKIIVLRAGIVAEQGTHAQLLENPDGVYTGLVKAQALEMGDDNKEEIDQQDEEEQLRRVQTQDAEKNKDKTIDDFIEPGWKERGVIRSFGVLIFEQRKRWFLYCVMVFSCAACGGEFSSIRASYFIH
jgi:ATP-binding cassette subfamily B (MDR/TAP) protein 1